MPETKFESFIFSVIMVFFMVFSMTTYTLALESGGLNGATFVTALHEMWLEYIIVLCMIFFVITKLAQRLAFRIVTPGADKPIFIILSIQCFTVCLTVPAITLIATFIHNGFTPNWFVSWIQLAVACFPMALCLQVFFAGPLVRLIFRTIFRRGARARVSA